MREALSLCSIKSERCRDTGLTVLHTQTTHTHACAISHKRHVKTRRRSEPTGSAVAFLYGNKMGLEGEVNNPDSTHLGEGSERRRALHVPTSALQQFTPDHN